MSSPYTQKGLGWLGVGEADILSISVANIEAFHGAATDMHSGVPEHV